MEVEPHGTREIGMFKLIVEGPEVDNTADTPNPLGIYNNYSMSPSWI